MSKNIEILETVTILILIDGFLQLMMASWLELQDGSHNPYFNRWFSAINEEQLMNFLLKLSQSLF